MSQIPSAIVPKKLLDRPLAKHTIQASPLLIESARMDAAAVYARLKTRPTGLTAAEVETRIAEHGPNVLQKHKRPSLLKLLWHAATNPLVILLAVLSTISFATGDVRAGGMMVAMIALSVGLKLVQEAKADSAAAKLKAMISVNATVVREGAVQEIRVERLVPGDVIHLAAWGSRSRFRRWARTWGSRGSPRSTGGFWVSRSCAMCS